MPFFLIFAAVVLITIWLFQYTVASSVYWNLVTLGNHGSAVSQPDESAPLIYEENDPVPVIFYGSNWATLNLDGWEYKDIPVYFGDSNELLAKGAGQSMFSGFCGEDKKIIISGHVTTVFYELEDVQLGDRVTMETDYGTFEYEVYDIFTFHYQDESHILSPVDEEVLMLYTCYPRQNGYAFKTERLAVMCRKISESWVENDGE